MTHGIASTLYTCMLHIGGASPEACTSVVFTFHTHTGPSKLNVNHCWVFVAINKCNVKVIETFLLDKTIYRKKFISSRIDWNTFVRSLPVRGKKKELSSSHPEHQCPGLPSAAINLYYMLSVPCSRLSTVPDQGYFSCHASRSPKPLPAFPVPIITAPLRSMSLICQ